MKYRVEIDIADRLVNDGFHLTEDIVVAGFEYTARHLGDRRHDVKPGDVQATIVQGAKFRSNIHRFMWECCDIREDYWVESSKLFRIWCAFRSDYQGKLTPGRLGKLIKAKYPHIKWGRKWLKGKQVSIYKGVRLRDIYVREADDDL